MPPTTIALLGLLAFQSTIAAGDPEGPLVKDKGDEQPAVEELYERARENQQREVDAEEAKWREKWIPDELVDEPSDYYFQAWLRSRDAKKGEGADKLRHLDAAIDALNNLQKKAPDWKPELMEKKLKQLREQRARIEEEAPLQE